MNVHADVFPARIAIAPPNSLNESDVFTPTGVAPEGTRRLDRCRVVLVNDQILIAVDSPEGPTLVFQEKTVSRNKEGKIYTVKTINGKTVSFAKDDACGCGSRLRSWAPYGNILMANDDN